MLKKVSIIVPIYNGENYIEDCMRALLGQTYPAIEIIAVNDGSTDNTAGILEKYSKTTKVKIVNRPNGGLSAARNSGIAVTTGDRIIFVDVDDVIHPELIERLLAIPDSDKFDVIIYDWRNVSLDKKNDHIPYTEGVEIVPFDSAFDYYMRSGISVSACRTLYKTSLIREHKFLEGVRYEDFDFTMRLLRKIGGGVHVKWPAYNYVQTSGSIIRSPICLDKFKDMDRVLRHVAADYASVQDPRFEQVKRIQIGDTVKKMILKPLKTNDYDNPKYTKRETLNLVGGLLRDGILAMTSLSIRWWPTLIYARTLCAIRDKSNVAFVNNQENTDLRQ